MQSRNHLLQQTVELCRLEGSTPIVLRPWSYTCLLCFCLLAASSSSREEMTSLCSLLSYHFPSKQVRTACLNIMWFTHTALIWTISGFFVINFACSSNMTSESDSAWNSKRNRPLKRPNRTKIEREMNFWVLWIDPAIVEPGSARRNHSVYNLVVSAAILCVWGCVSSDFVCMELCQQRFCVYGVV